MNRTTLALAAVLSVAAFGAHADDADPSGQYANSVAPSTVTRAAVQADLQQYRKAGVNPWSTSYNPQKEFRSQRSRAEVTNEFLASRNAVAAMTGEDSGAAYLAARKSVNAQRQLASQPSNAAE